METDDRTSTGEGSSRRGRPPVRVAAKPARLGATGRLGGEVAAARAPARVLRAATRLSAPRPGASAAEPAETIARSAAEAPVAPPAPAAAGEPTPVGMADWEAAWIFGGDSEQAIALSRRRRRQPRSDVSGGRAFAAPAQPRREDRRRAGVRLAGARAATVCGDGAAALGRPRGRRADAATRAGR